MVASILDRIKTVEDKQIRKDLPVINVGDFVKMRVKVKEAEKIRIHPFEGTVIKISGRGSKGTFTVRKISFGEGVERIFPIHSPVIESLKVISKGVTKRARLYYLRDRVGKKSHLRKDMQPTGSESVAAV